MWLAEESPGWDPRHSIRQAAVVLGFTLHWRHFVATASGLTLAKHCLTRETILDTVISCVTCIMRFPLFRDRFPLFKPYGPNISSRCSEYGFRFARKDTPKLSVRSFMLAFKHYLAEISMRATAPDGLKLPTAKHGHRLVEDSIKRVVFDPPPPGWQPTDDEICTLINLGLADVRTLYMSVCNRTLNPSADLFVQPWKHLNLAATWKPKSRRKTGAGAGKAAAVPRGDAGEEDSEEDGKEDGEDEAEIAVADEDDMAEAGRLIGSLVAQHSSSEPGGAEPPPPGKLAVSRRLGGIFSGFNRSIMEEWNLRKFRFRQQKLLRTRESAGGRAAAGESDHIEFGTDAVVLYIGDNGQWSWAVGHVEGITVSRVLILPNKASPPELEIASRTADFRPRVDIDDSQAMFLFRYFLELDKNGKVLEGYGNRTCTAYRLPISDHQPVFEWTSNHQVLCAVTLQHVDQHVWSLRPNDAKDIRARVADVIAAQGRGQGPGLGTADRWANKQKPSKHARPASCDEAAVEKTAAEVASIISAAAAAATAGRAVRAASRAAARRKAQGQVVEVV